MNSQKHFGKWPLDHKMEKLVRDFPTDFFRYTERNNVSRNGRVFVILYGLCTSWRFSKKLKSPDRFCKR